MKCTPHLAEIFVECSAMWAEVVEAEQSPRWGWLHLAALGLLTAFAVELMIHRYQKERTR